MMAASQRKALLQSRCSRARLGALLAAALAAAALGSVHAEELSVVKLVVPAGKRFKIEISNEGKGPMEFESRDLKQEKVLAAGAKSSVVINGLKPGTYVFFDDYHPDAPKGQVVAK